jgi:hypothetical protein
MLPTFSVNANPFDKKAVKRVVEIIKDLNENSYNCEWAGEAFLKAVTKEDVGNINLSSYAQSCMRNTQMTQLSRPETTILTQEELNQGYVGITDVVAEYVEDNIDDIISNLDVDYYVEYFLETRENLYFSKGQDIWRLIKLAKLDDKQAQNKLRVLMDEFELRDLLYYVLTKSACFNKLEVVLC